MLRRSSLHYNQAACFANCSPEFLILACIQTAGRRGFAGPAASTSWIMTNETFFHFTPQSTSLPVFVHVFSMNLFCLTPGLHSKCALSTLLKKLWRCNVSESWRGVRCDSPDLCPPSSLSPCSLSSPPLPHLLCRTSPQPGTISHLTFNELYNQSKAAINSTERKRGEKMIGTLWDTDRHGTENSFGTSR